MRLYFFLMISQTISEFVGMAGVLNDVVLVVDNLFQNTDVPNNPSFLSLPGRAPASWRQLHRFSLG
jgi:hypothetical protein